MNVAQPTPFERTPDRGRGGGHAPSEAPAEQRLTLGDGATAAVRDDALELHDAEGRLLLRYRDGDLELSAPRGNVTLRAEGEVRLESGDSALVVGRSGASVVAKQVDIVADRVHTAATRICTEADQIVQRSRDYMNEVSELHQTRAGRVRQLVQDVFTLYARRNVQVSTDDTTIDGKRILLG